MLRIYSKYHRKARGKFRHNRILNTPITIRVILDTEVDGVKYFTQPRDSGSKGFIKNEEGEKERGTKVRTNRHGENLSMPKLSRVV